MKVRQPWQYLCHSPLFTCYASLECFNLRSYLRFARLASRSFLSFSPPRLLSLLIHLTTRFPPIFLFGQRPKGPMSCRTQGGISRHPSILPSFRPSDLPTFRPSILPPPLDHQGLKLALLGLNLALKSAFFA